MKAIDSKGYILKIKLNRDNIEDYNEYPFSLHVVSKLKELNFHEKVTFFVGENGSGKSTLLEALAVACGFNPEGGTLNFTFSTKETHSNLYEYLKLQRGILRPKNGFFLRAETFYNLATHVDYLDSIPAGSRKISESYGGKSLHKQSHGESFMSLFLNRFGGKGLYILDEPEAALSPVRQMALISKMHELVKNDSQFIIATHSPIVMSYPDSIIYNIDEAGIQKVKYEETEHYSVNKQFANNYKAMLKELME